MKRLFLSIFILATTITAMAQATQPCVVKQYNQKHQKTPLAGVQVEVRGAQTATSAANGAVTLQFATLKPGDRVPFRAATKAGYELMNKTAVEQWNISRDQHPFEIVLVQSAYFTQLKSNLKQSSVDSYHKKYEQTLAQLEKLKKEGELKEQEYYDKLNELEDRYDSQLKNLDTYVDQFARIDLSELSEQEQQFIELAHAGRLDEAAEAYNALNAAGKYITAVENVRRLNEDIAKLEDEKAQQQEAAKTFFSVLQRQVNTLKLAGGEENYKKAGELLKRAALADTTNVEVVWEYAIYAHNQHHFKDAERFWLIALNGSRDNLYLQVTLQNNLGILSFDLHDYAKAEEYYLQVLEKYNQLFRQNPDAFRKDLANTQNNIGNLYLNLRNYAKAEECHLKALENCTLLFSQNPDAYRADLATTQNDLGNLYLNLHNYAKAEEYYLQVIENRIQLFHQNPDAYREDLAGIQNNLGTLYDNLRNYTKAEEYFLQTLENYTQLFHQNPDAYRYNLAITQNNLGALYSALHDYAKAEEFYLQALENRTQLFRQNPDAYRTDLASIQNNLGNLYKNLHNYAKAEEYHLQALDNYTQMFRQNPDAYRTDLASIQNNLGNLYSNLHDYAKAEEFYLKALENKAILFSQNPEAYRADLAKIQKNLGSIYKKTNEFAKSEDFLLKALENCTLLFSQAPDAYRADLASTLQGLGFLYYDQKDWKKTEDFLLKAHTQYEMLFRNAPDIYRKELARTQFFLIRSYYNNSDAIQIWDSLLNNALTNYEILFQNGESNKENLALLKTIKGTLLLKSGKTEEAVQILDSSDSLCPGENDHTLALAYMKRGAEYYDEQDTVNAIKYVGKALLYYTLLWHKKQKEYRNVLNLTKMYMLFKFNSSAVESFYQKEENTYIQLYEQNTERYGRLLAAIQEVLANDYAENDSAKVRYYHKAIDNYTLLCSIKPDTYRRNLADIMERLAYFHYKHHDYAKAEEYYLKALEYYNELFIHNQNANREKLADTQHALGNLYYFDLKDYIKAEDFYVKALTNRTKLYEQDSSSVNCNDLAWSQYRLGELYYFYLKDYSKAEDFYLKALTNRAKLYEQDSSSDNCANLAWTQFRLGELYYLHIKDYTKAEDIYLKALENRTQLYDLKSSSDNCNDLAWTQFRLGNLYYLHLKDYTKAENFYLKALENRIQLFSEKPDTYREDLASSYNQLAYLYAHQNNFAKALETIDKAIELMPEDADYYDTKGEILLMKGDEQEAVKMWQKVLELDPDFLKKYEGGTDFYKQLKEKGLIND